MGEARVEQVGRKWLLLPSLKIPGACKCRALEDLIPIGEAVPVTVRPGGDGGMIAASGAVWYGAAIPKVDVIDALVSLSSLFVAVWPHGRVELTAEAEVE